MRASRQENERNDKSNEHCRDITQETRLRVTRLQRYVILRDISFPHSRPSPLTKRNRTCE